MPVVRPTTPGGPAGPRDRIHPAFPPAKSGMRFLADWRTPADGPTNMRRDRELLEAATEGAVPTLRLYRWSRTTLTLGHGQRLERAADPAALAKLGVPWVRRPTGGRALLHQPDELTYAFAAPRGVAPGVREAYFRIMEAIGEALARFVRLDPLLLGALVRDTAPPRLPCHAVATGHELSAEGRKLVSGAQRWRRGAFLQHGSIPWTVDRRLTNALVGLPPDSPVGAVGLEELTAGEAGNGPPSIGAVADALRQSFRRKFGECVLV